MGNPAGVKRNFEALEKRRLQAFKLLEAGWPQAEVSPAGWEFIANPSTAGPGGQGQRQRSFAQSGPGRSFTPVVDRSKRNRSKPPCLKDPKRTVMPRRYGPLRRVGALIKQQTGCQYHAGPCLADAALALAGVPSARPAGRWNGMRKPSRIGRRRNGRALKKSPERKPHTGLCR